MKKILLITLVIAVSFSCKTKKKAINDTPPEAPHAVVENQAAVPSTTGKVSHQYKATGCTTVIIVKSAGEENQMTLIPKDKLPDNMDVDGKEIMFDYRLLRMPNPQGCNVGIPAELTNLLIK